MLAIGDPGGAPAVAGQGPPVLAARGDIVLSQASVAGVAVRAAATRGLQHYAADTPRQDAFAVAARGSTVVAVLCDGLGSLSESHRAADLVSSSVCGTLAMRRTGPEPGTDGDPTSSFASDIDLATRTAAELVVPSQGRPPSMATTMVALEATWLLDHWDLNLAWVGDSSCWHVAKDGTWTLLTIDPSTSEADPRPRESGLQTGRTDALPRDVSMLMTRHDTLTAGVIVAVSDGIGKPVAAGTTVRRALASWWLDEPPSLLEFGAQVDFARVGFQDDRAAVALWSPPPTEPSPEPPT